MTPTLRVGGIGIISPVGIGITMVNTSVQSGINRYADSDIIGFDEEPIRMALVPQKALSHTIDSRLLKGTFDEYYLRLLGLALAALDDLAPSLPKESIPLFLAGPEHYIEKLNINKLFIENLAIQSDIDIDINASRVINIGRAGGIDIIDLAFKFFNSTEDHYLIIGGVDSFYDVALLEYLQQNTRLTQEFVLDGFIPGEGAGFLLLISPFAPEKFRHASIAGLCSLGLGQEQHHRLSDNISHGTGLCEAISQTVDTAPLLINEIYSCENGERHYAKELSVALIRNESAIKKEYRIFRPAENFGDIGAAFGPTAIGLACVNRHGHDTSASLVYGSSDSGARATICVVT